MIEDSMGNGKTLKKSTHIGLENNTFNDDFSFSLN